MLLLGPCSAETREQTLITARQIQKACGDIPFVFRAGVWKPRTSPHTFQGAGDEALMWLNEIKNTYGLHVATEVASPEHVRKALDADINYLWIGARTSANPIAVQTIADELIARKQKPTALLIKNPVNADPNLWLGNIERLEKTGLPVIAIHRGCNHLPCWAMAHNVRLKRPDIPMLLDPSHMSGDAAQVPKLTKKIPELELDGAMIEVHANPENALSDAKQQITSDCCRAVIESISNQLRTNFETLSRDYTCSKHKSTELNWLRAEIDELDDRLWETLAARMDVSQRIGKWKKENGVAPLQPERFQEILTKRQLWAQKNGMDAAFIEQIFSAIHNESLRRQK